MSEPQTTPHFRIDGRVMVGKLCVGSISCERDLPPPNWRLRMTGEREASWHYLRRDAQQAAEAAIRGKQS